MILWQTMEQDASRLNRENQNSLCFRRFTRDYITIISIIIIGLLFCICVFIVVFSFTFETLCENY